MNKKLFINLPVTASTHKYASMLPHPMLILNNKANDDDVIDLVLETYQKNDVDVRYILNDIKHFMKKISKYDHFVINCGEYAPDGYYDKWIEYFLKDIDIKSTSIMGTYTLTSKNRLSKIFNKGFVNLQPSIFNMNLNTHNVIISDDILKKHPKVDNKIKATMRLSLGCPRKCTFCPVTLIYHGCYQFFDIDRSVERIKYYYDRDVRFINFIDDNISCNLLKMKEFLSRSFSSSIKFLCQEGFEASAYADQEFCKLLSQSNFIDNKIAIENINSNFLKNIGKFFSDISVIHKAIENIHKFNLKTKSFLLLSSEQTEDDILGNIKFAIENNLDLRVNILRQYDNMQMTNVNTNEKQLNHLKALAYAAVFMNERFSINIFDHSSLDKLINKMNYTIKISNDTLYVYGRNLNFGFRTSRFLKALKYMTKHMNITKIELISHEKTN